MVPAAAATRVFSVVGVHFSASTVTVSGLQTKPLTIKMHVKASPAIPTYLGYVGVFLGRTAGTGTWINASIMGMGLRLVSGDGSDGVWAGTYAVPATASGTWTPVAVDQGYVQPKHGSTRYGLHNVHGLPNFTVVGTHISQLSAGQVPSATPFDATPFTVKGRLTDADTGAGLPGVRLSYGIRRDCFPGNHTPVTTTDGPVTDSSGYYSVGFTGNAEDAKYLVCFTIKGPTQSDGQQQLLLFRLYVPWTATWIGCPSAGDGLGRYRRRRHRQRWGDLIKPRCSCSGYRCHPMEGREFGLDSA